MVRIVFPTNKKLSYISEVERSFENSKYLTVLNVSGQNIISVETIKNPHPSSTDEIIRECKMNKFEILIVPEVDNLPCSKLKENGIFVFKSMQNKTIINSFSDFVQDKLVKVY